MSDLRACPVCRGRKWAKFALCLKCRERDRESVCLLENPPTPLNRHRRCGGRERLRHKFDDTCGSLVGEDHELKPEDLNKRGVCGRCRKHRRTSRAEGRRMAKVYVEDRLDDLRERALSLVMDEYESMAGAGQRFQMPADAILAKKLARLMALQLMRLEQVVRALGGE